MNKKEKKKRRRIKKILRFIIILFFLCIIGVILYFIKIENVYIKGNNYIKESDILEVAFKDGYKSLFLTSRLSIQNKLKKAFPLIESIKVSKSLNRSITIDIKESDIYFIYNNNYILNKDITLSLESGDYQAPTLEINNTSLTDDIYNKLVENITKVDVDIIKRTSEIVYYPNVGVDDERFVFLMNDGNYIYTTISKFSYINLYDDIKPILEGKKGILYLDSYRENDKAVSFKLIN